MIDFEGLMARELQSRSDPESHVERDLSTFHPSQISRCKRQCVISKFGLTEPDVQTLGYFEIGHMWHQWVERNIGPCIPGTEWETPVELEAADGLIRFVGRADCHDRVEGVIYDIKTRGGWYKWDPPDKAHVDQIHIYMAALGAEAGQVVYLNKKDLEIRTWPEDDLFEFDHDRFDHIVGRALDISSTLDHEGLPETIEDVPFDPCGCWLCDREGS